MSDHVSEFASCMSDEGVALLDPGEIIGDNKVRRAHMVGDRRGEPSITYSLDAGGDFAIGWMVAWKISNEPIRWHSKPQRGRTQEQRDQAAAWQAERRAEIEAERERVRADGAVARDRLWSGAWPVASHPYLDRKGLTPCDGVREADGVLLVPMMRDGVMVGLQRIQPDGGKYYLPGSEVAGAWFEIAGDADTVLVAEGYATGLRLHRVTGWTVAVAFSAGQMAACAVAVRARWPDSRVIIAGDNDQWTFDGKKTPAGVVGREVAGDDARWAQWRDEGRLVNPGRLAAEQAAGRIGGAVVLLPGIGSDDPGKGTDWDDYARAVGDAAVKAAFDAVGDTRGAAVEDEWRGDEVGPTWEDVRHPVDGLRALTGPLGFDKDVYYFLPKTKGQIIELSAGALWTLPNLTQLGSLSDYCMAMQDGSIKPSELAAMVSPMLMEICHSIGPYDPSKVFGAGAWRFGDRVYVNTGAAVYDCKSGMEMSHRDVEVDGVFVRDPRSYYLDCAALSNAEAHKLMQICAMPKWKRSISGTLLAGFLVVASVGGALRWRPHVFLTGPKGSGKSTLVEMVVEAVLVDSELRQDGGSTEAGLRLAVGDSSRPVVMDEFEGENKRDAEEVGRILFWARKASSGGVIVKANGKFRAKSCVCFAAINPLVSQGADADRITLLELEVNRRPDAEEHFKTLTDMIHETLTVDYARRLVRRTVDNIDALLWNVEVFSRHAARILKSKRDGDQFGPMLAGAYMLHATGKVTDELAEEYCARQDWSWVHDQKEGTDSERLIRRILNSMVEYSMIDRTVRMPVSEMVTRILTGEPGSDHAAKALARVGMVVKDDHLCVANNDDGLSGLLAGTPWVVYRPSLSRLDGVTSDGRTMRFGAGSPRRYMRVPLAGLVDGVRVVEELDIEGWDDDRG